MKLDVVVHTRNPSLLRGGRGSGVDGQPQVHRKFQASVNCTVGTGNTGTINFFR